MKFDCKTCAVAARQSISLARLFKGRKSGKKETGVAFVTSRRVAPARFPTQESTWEYLVSFTLSDGRSIELRAPQQTYEALKDGITGSLSWQGEDLLDFTEEA